jgi:hypothetical protein
MCQVSSWDTLVTVSIPCIQPLGFMQLCDASLLLYISYGQPTMCGQTGAACQRLPSWAEALLAYQRIPGVYRLCFVFICVHVVLT